MQKKGANISLKGYDDIFSTDQSRAEAQQERVQEIPLSELHPFEGHPFRVVDDEEMMKTAESVRDFGVLTPAIVRPDPDGGYEIVSGHRRHRASELAGKETMPAIVRDLDDDAAIILMVDANLQRESILPSERAFAYKMKLDAIKHQGQRTDLTSSQVGMKLQAMDIVGQEAGESRNQVHRYIRLTELIPELLDALFEKFKKDNPNASSNPLSRWRQKHNIKKEYAAARAGKGGKATAKGAGKTAKGVKSLTQKIADFCVSHKTALLWVLAIGLLFMVISGMFSACSTMFQGGTQVVLGTSFTAEDEDILGTDEDYTALENDLRSQVDNIESTHPGYDEYRYALDEIGHNPYELAAYLTVVFEDYTREEVQAELVRLFEEQYDLELDEEVEIRSYTTTDEDGNTSTVYYEYRILNVTLTNYGLGNVIASSRLTAEQWERYKVLLETLGNRSYLFGEDVSSAPGGGGEYTDYDIPGEALTDTAFANMVREAEKYLGYPYVWGGSSPSTSFDCSGFVSWVINNCGNGWSVGRQTANGLKNLCDIIPPSEAKPGDLIFFQGTYNTSGASHVGIYVGNGMMIHCGDPISYASIETNYWQQHFYCFGRIP